MRETPRACWGPRIEHAIRISDEIDAAEEKREVNALALAVHLNGEIGQLLPTFELGAIVERHHDELRRAIDACLRWRGNGEHQSHCSNELRCNHRAPIENRRRPVYGINELTGLWSAQIAAV
jgi:hypothetical protein